MAFFSNDADELKRNQDYQELLRTLAILEAQKVQAIKDLEYLEQLKLQASNDPHEVYRVIASDKVSGESPLPPQQMVAPLPIIDWTKYGGFSNSAGNRAAGNYNTRKKKPPGNDGGVKSDSISCIEDQMKKDNKKGGSYGQPWTEEEQRRLEELLRIYPSEEVEAKRWQKIADALGNRTTKQVCCRVQKYFIKLAKAGLPVPGRMPNLATYAKKSRIRRSSTRQPSIFFNSLKPKVYMMTSNEDNASTDSTSSSSSDEYSCNSPIAGAPSHSKCTGCHSYLDSIHWYCKDCSGSSSKVLLCLECVKSNWNDNSHVPSHDMMECLPTSSSGAHSSTTVTSDHQLVDTDYTKLIQPSSSFTDYNYLDPNFCPAL